jgi:diguanylate cyclase (GGDEF)-like protein/PAS domain S-box-containing protein
MRTPRRHRITSGETTPPELLAKALASVANAIFITDQRGCIVWANDAFSRLSGYSQQEAIGQTPSLLKSGKQDPSFYRELWQTIVAGSVWRGEVVERHKDGSYFTVDEVITPLRDDRGAITHYIAIQHDITRHKQESERERYLAYHDTLTGLPNRAQFLDVLEQAVANARAARKSLALLYVDIDNFKSVNDTLGHEGGDRLLVAVAERLSAAVRKTDTVARLGGDEFAILQTDFISTDVATLSGRKLLNSVSQPFVLDGHKVYASVSIGIAMYPVDGERAQDLLRNADQAMYRAKNQGRNRYQLYAEIAPHIVALEHAASTAKTRRQSPSQQRVRVTPKVPVR